MSESSSNAAEPCRNCGTDTTQRAEGVPYCSASCINGRRRELEHEHIRCPYPGCPWETSYLPGNGLSKAVAYQEAEDHREDHQPNGLATERETNR